MKRLLIVGMVLAAGFVAGCSGGSPVGTYELDKDHFNKQMDEKEAAAKSETERAGIALGRSFAESMIGSMEIELKEDGTATVTAMGAPTTGTYTVEGNKVKLSMSGATATGGFGEMTYNGMKGTLSASNPGPDGENFEIQFKKKKS